MMYDFLGRQTKKPCQPLSRRLIYTPVNNDDDDDDDDSNGYLKTVLCLEIV